METLTVWLNAGVECIGSLWNVVTANPGLSAIFGIGIISAAAGGFLAAKRAAR